MTSAWGHAAKKRVQFTESEPEKVELSEDTIAVKVTTPACTYCGKTSVVILSRQEFKDVAEGYLAIQDALPTRDADFRELLKSGIHPECWDAMTGGGDD